MNNIEKQLTRIADALEVIALGSLPEEEPETPNTLSKGGRIIENAKATASHLKPNSHEEDANRSLTGFKD